MGGRGEAARGGDLGEEDSGLRETDNDKPDGPTPNHPRGSPMAEQWILASRRIEQGEGDTYDRVRDQVERHQDDVGDYGTHDRPFFGGILGEKLAGAIEIETAEITSKVTPTKSARSRSGGAMGAREYEQGPRG